MKTVSKIIKSKGSSSSIANASVSVIRDALFAIGARTTGGKSLLLQRLRWELSTAGVAKSQMVEQKRPLRVVSVDMGIRNLAFVVCDVELGAGDGEGDGKSRGEGGLDVIRALVSSPHATRSSPLELPSPRVTVQHWTRIALDEHQPLSTGSSSPTAKAQESPDLIDPDKQDPYHPAQLSRTATTLLQHLLSYRPDVIIIERQRHRSGGGAAIQEWTVRVNSLEAMLYSGLRMRAALIQDASSKEGLENNGQDIAVYGVSPAAVAQFWVLASGTPVMLESSEVDYVEVTDGSVSKAKGENKKPSPPRRKIEKKDKIAVAASWLQTPTIPSPPPPFTLTFENQAASVRDVFLSRWQNGERKRPLRRTQKDKNPADDEDISTSTAEGILGPVSTEVFNTSLSEIKKLDDLADCLLQAGAWVTWQRNRAILAERLDFGGVAEGSGQNNKKAKVLRGRGDEMNHGGGQIKNNAVKKRRSLPKPRDIMKEIRDSME